MCKYAIDLEINTIMPEFGLAAGDIASPEYSEATGHVVFDMKMDIMHKIRLLKNGHQSPDLIE